MTAPVSVSVSLIGKPTAGYAPTWAWRRAWAKPTAACLMQRLWPFAFAMLGVTLTTALIGLVLSAIGIANISMLYLLVVLVVAARYGAAPATFACVAAFLAFNWFHIHPVHTLTIADPEEWLALLLFLAVAVVTSQLAAAQRRRAEEAQRREREARALHQLGRLLAGTDPVVASVQAARPRQVVGPEQALDLALAEVVEHLRKELGLAGCAVLLPESRADGALAVSQSRRGTEAAGSVPGLIGGTGTGGTIGTAFRARAVAGVPIPAEEQSVPEWLAPRSGSRRVKVRPPARSSAGRPTEGIEMVPLKAGERTVGYLRLAVAHGRAEWEPEERRLLAAAADQLGLAIERTRLRQEATEAEVLRQTDEARKALLASVSHDLRTPLASIKASAGSLLQEDVRWTREDRRGFAEAIEQEADRLNRLVQNLLDMTRIESGALQPERDWYALDALVDDTLGRLRGLTAGHVVTVEMADDLPPIPLDYVQVGQVLYNLIENATKYTPAASHIHVEGRRDGEMVCLSVADDGPGIAPESLSQVFHKFFRVRSGDTARVLGTGLGLAVARGIAEAHGGTLEVASPPPGAQQGTVFTLRLPLRLPGAGAGATPMPRWPETGPETDR